MNERKLHRAGQLRGEKVSYEDGVGCCIWIPLDEDDENCGICFDFSETDIGDMMDLLMILKNAEPDIYEEDTKWDEIKKNAQPTIFDDMT